MELSASGSFLPVVFIAEDELALVLFTPNNATYECKNISCRTDDSKSPSLDYKAVRIRFFLFP